MLSLPFLSPYSFAPSLPPNIPVVPPSLSLPCPCLYPLSTLTLFLCPYSVIPSFPPSLPPCSLLSLPHLCPYPSPSPLLPSPTFHSIDSILRDRLPHLIIPLCRPLPQFVVRRDDHDGLAVVALKISHLTTLSARVHIGL